MDLIKSTYSSYDDKKLSEVRYGLEAIYLTITKITVLFIMCLIIGNFTDMVIVLTLCNLLKITGFGLHAKKSSTCLISTLFVFGIMPIFLKMIVLDKVLRVILALIFTVGIFIYSPADTHKRPIVNMKKRKIYKILTTTTALIYTITVCIISSNFIGNALVYSLLVQLILINPLSYKILNLPYNNYKKYIKKEVLI